RYAELRRADRELNLGVGQIVRIRRDAALDPPFDFMGVAGDEAERAAFTDLDAQRTLVGNDAVRRRGESLCADRQYHRRSSAGTGTIGEESHRHDDPLRRSTCKPSAATRYCVFALASPACAHSSTTVR